MSPPADLSLEEPGTLRDLVRRVRRAAADAGDWRVVVDGLRPSVDRLWGNFTPAEQEAFLGPRVRALLVRLAAKDAYSEAHTRAVSLLAVQLGERLGLSKASRSTPLKVRKIAAVSGEAKTVRRECSSNRPRIPAGRGQSHAASVHTQRATSPTPAGSSFAPSIRRNCDQP